MHMGALNLRSSDRDAAARRTSEETAAASKVFNQSGYKSLRRIKQSLPESGLQQHTTAAKGQTKNWARSPSQPGNGSIRRTATLSPHETKVEQARLLTLLRSLNPVMVVDQLCKGLAYFGGIPGAPPPVGDIGFPQSDSANGSGAYFVGWLAEIFPNMDTPKPPSLSISASTPPLTSQVITTSAVTVPVAPTAPRSLTPDAPSTPPAAPVLPVPSESTTEQPVVPAKRKRGRPKGSKSSKVRADKGRRHMSKALKYSIPLVVPTSIDEDEDEDVAEAGQIERDTAESSNDVTRPVLPNSSTTATVPGGNTGPKKRGRPKGSKNRPKNHINNENQVGPDPGEAGPAPVQPVSASGTANAENVISSIDYPAPSTQFVGGEPDEASVTATSRQPNLPAQQTPNNVTGKSPPKKRKSTQHNQSTVSATKNDVADSSQTSHAHGTNSQRVSQGTGPNPDITSQPVSVSSSFGSQSQATTSTTRGAMINSQTSQTSQPSRPDHYYMTAAPQQQQGSPNLNHAIPGQQTNRPFTSQHVNMASQNYYNPHSLQQASHHMTSIGPSSGSFGHTMAGNTNTSLSQNQAKQNSGQRSAGPQARGRRQGPQSNQRRQPVAQQSTNATMDSYSSFNNQSFM